MAEKKKSTKKAPRTPEVDLYTITDLEQARVLADPLRLRILESLCEQEATTKQVAEQLGEKPTKLYHHVDALERVGLIRLSRTRQNRGTLEKYYVAVARAFRADKSLFAGAEERGHTSEELETLARMITTVFERTSAEMLELGKDPSILRNFEDKVLLSYFEVQGTEAEMRKLNRRLQKLIEGLSNPGDAPPGHRRFRLTLAFYPLDLADADKPGDDENKS